MAFRNLLNRITFPGGARSGQPRMVVGAKTPSELAVFGIDQALLSYVTDVVTGVEVGYFFIGSSNRMDGTGKTRAMVFGNVTYPTPGDPDSATQNDVATNFQQNMKEQVLVDGGDATIFKDHRVFFWTSVDIDPLINSGDLKIGGISQGRGPRGSMQFITGTLIGSVGAEVPLVAWGNSVPTEFVLGRMYKITAQGGIFDSAGTVHQATVRIRATQNSIATMQLAFWRINTPAGINAFVDSWTRVAYVKVTGAAATLIPGITIQRSVGAGTISLYGDGNIPCTVQIEDVGRADDARYAALAATVI
jgi:hypothetical protein